MVSMHNLNLVLQKLVKNIKQYKMFLIAMFSFASFFSLSPNRTHALDEILSAVSFQQLQLDGLLNNNTLLNNNNSFNNQLIKMAYANKEELTMLFYFIWGNETMFDAVLVLYKRFHTNFYD